MAEFFFLAQRLPVTMINARAKGEVLEIIGTRAITTYPRVSLIPPPAVLAIFFCQVSILRRHYVITSCIFFFVVG